MENMEVYPYTLRKLHNFMSELDCLKLKICQIAGDKRFIFCSHISKKNMLLRSKDFKLVPFENGMKAKRCTHKHTVDSRYLDFGYLE